MSDSDHRRHHRFDLSLPVKVRPAATLEIETSTKDISASGISFTMSRDCELGSELEWELTLPPELCQGNNVRIRCRGKVVRVDRLDAPGKIGVAATIETYEFVKS